MTSKAAIDRLLAHADRDGVGEPGRLLTGPSPAPSPLSARGDDGGKAGERP